jgi:UDP-N-acetylmuramoylalanine--D-glutamate ligase
MEAELSGAAKIEKAASLEEAVARAQEITQPGSVVLLSPGCSSFDMFTSFEQRGEMFINAVNALQSRGEG